ncbi:GntR family transcriptional regulator [Dactylosporangium roseum]|uniref:GntR family transcriptional regulator n=1 Tax=Dactylosporangium roseum TaxID=47989 RepID=A0ABY5YYC7_9ACTN|nr:GntR family transcriptional regulator [Dactylosporangium roseum]UWZ34532.1 GntR family transcriptional regulator [Dactylosporangium roseum]
MRLTRSTLKDQALDVIRQSLVTGEIAPGEIHSTVSLATRLGTSSGPVREAMLVLVEQGIMEVVGNRGFRAVSLTGHDLGEVYDLRLMLEVPAMRRLARQGLDDGAAALVRDHAQRCQAAAAAGDLTGFLSADREFHLRLTEMLGNARLVKFVGQLRDQTRLYGLPSLAAEDRLAESTQEHFELLDAILNHDSDRAEQVMTKHLAHVRGDWSSAVEPSPSPEPQE